MEQLVPSLIMLIVTIGFAAVLILPMAIKVKSDLVRFYWRGFWMFLVLITLVAGGATALQLMGVTVDPLSEAMLTGIMASYILFVVFAWFRLAGAALFLGLRRFRRAAFA